MATLPRPSRPSYGPPNTPLPSLPVSKTRQGVQVPPATPSQPRAGSGASLLPAPLTASRSASSALPTRSSLPGGSKQKQAATSNLPTTNGSTPSQPAKKLRKTISIGAFPQPPSSRPSSGDASPASATTPTTASRSSEPSKSSSQRDSSQKRVPPRKSSRMTAVRSYSSGTSFLNGGDHKSISVQNLPSPPASRPTSSHGSQGDEERGRSASVDGLLDGDKHGKDGKGNVLVSVRVRPDQKSAKEDANSDLEWMVDGRRSLIGYRGREGGEYNYDNVFTVHDKNGKVYDSSAKRLVRRVMEGYHGTVFAYGMTGTGKTFSMQGTATSPGIIPLAITDIFSFIRETPQREFLLRVSYLEIYNEKIHDLLADALANGAPPEEIKLREDSKRGVYATPLKEEIVQSPTQLLRVIARGDNARRVAGTQFNARSSRSHAVVQIVVESRERSPPNQSLAETKRQALLPGGVRVSTLSLIDLAGSERAADDKERRTEGAHINKSLLTLATVISKLSSDKEKPGVSAKDAKHLPYRDSKLTRLLQPALAGDSLISILCTIQIGSAGSIATAQNHTLETLNTLKFASRAKNNIVSHAKKAQEAFGGAGDAGSRALLDRYRVEIMDLRKQLESQGKKEKKDDEENAEKIKEIEQENRHEEQMLEMQLARTALKERIEHLNRLILSSKSLGVNNPRSISQMSNGRASVMTSGDTNRSTRSSTATLEAPGLHRNSSANSMRSFRQSSASTMIMSNGVHEGHEDEEDSLGENGDGVATSAIQIRSLQADLADKNRYIGTLEKRLLQARRSSHSRVSMSFSQRVSMNEDGGVESIIREKDAEIAELRARLDDKERMVAALRSATRKRDVADLTVDTSHSSPVDRRSNSSGESMSAGPVRAVSMSPRVLSMARSPRESGVSPRSSAMSIRSNANPRESAMSVMSIRSSVMSSRATNSFSPAVGVIPEKKRGKSVDEMTRLLDEMITERVQNENGTGGAVQERTDSRVDSGISVGAPKGSRRTSVRISEPLPSSG
ncbi:kinesin-domain-containing protein [Tothia fuscella]|uniref:Kinesin-like protein KIP2 n=1 Tax=Tothia fuscella TaxID=1048955 RepID=A0A9P4NQJ1_9PEZI|nr:kinesin-domain-containing protein [Tothia fuscella]